MRSLVPAATPPEGVPTSLPGSRRQGLRRALTPGLLAVVIAGSLGAAGVLAVHRGGAHDSASSGPGAEPRRAGRPVQLVPGPSEPGLPITTSSAIHPRGRGVGLARLIPCYTVTSHELSSVLHAPMAVVGQRAAGENGGGLSGAEREDCFWFSSRPNGPYVVLSDVTSDQLRGRKGMSGWTARRYFTDVPPRTRTYLTGLGDAAYAYGPGSVAVLVGDVYLDVGVVSDDGHPLRDAVAIAKLMSKLRTTLAR